MEIQAQKAFFIKLGRSGSWAPECINNSRLQLGFKNPHHQKCIEGDWDFIRNYWKNDVHKTDGKATETTNQIRYFYESEADVLWITFHNRKLYWCFSKRENTELAEGIRIRPCKDSWSCKDQKWIDLVLESPVTGKKAFVQVKSESDLPTFQEYVGRFKNMNQYDEMYFVAHSPIKGLRGYDGDHCDKIINVDRIAELSINSGLADWIISKSM